MAKEKKPLTIRQKQKRYSALSKVCFAGEYVSVATPFIVLGGVNFQEWFVENPEGWKISIGATISLALMGLITTMITKKKEDTTITNGFIAFTIGWYVVAMIFILLNSVIHDIAQIMLVGGTGLLGAAGLEVESKNLAKKSNTLKEIIGDTERDMFKEQAKKEFEAEKEQQPTE